MNVQETRFQELQRQQEHYSYFRIAWEVIKRKWWLILLILGITEGFVFQYAKIPEGPYKAVATVKPVSTSGGGGRASTFGLLLGGSSYRDTETEIEVIKSRKVAERVVRKLGLDKQTQSSTMGEGEAPAEPVVQNPESNDRMRELVESIQNRLEVDWKEIENRRRVNLLEITARSYSAKEAMDLANAVAEAYVEIYGESKQKLLQDLQDILKQEQEKVRNELDESKRKLYETSKEKGVIAAFSGILGAGHYVDSEYPIDIYGLKTSIMQKEIQLKVLRKDFPDADPKVASLIEEINNIKEALKKEEEKAKEKFDEQFDLVNAAAEVEFKQQVYSMLMSNQQELIAQNVLQQGGPEIVERALEPRFPSEQSRRSGLSLGAAAGLLLGIAISVLLEYIDTSMRTNADVIRGIGLPVLGQIPRLRNIRKKPKSDLLITYNSARSSRRRKWLREHYKESYRVLQVEVMAALKRASHGETGNNHGLTLLVSSSVPDEGRSTVAANLAISIAQTGKKVLLVDADCRHPTQHAFLGVDNTTGLADVLAGDLVWSEAMKKSLIGNISVITSGQENGQIDCPAAIGSLTMDALINLWKEEFDVIVFDSPSANLASESVAVGSKVDGVVLVIKAGSTKRHNIQRVKENIEYSDGNIFGIVLNFAAPGKKGFRKYFS